MKVRITSLGGMLSVGCRMALSSSVASIRIDMDVGKLVYQNRFDSGYALKQAVKQAVGFHANLYHIGKALLNFLKIPQSAAKQQQADRKRYSEARPMDRD